jgi:hypothetical protein
LFVSFFLLPFVCFFISLSHTPIDNISSESFKRLTLYNYLFQYYYKSKKYVDNIHTYKQTKETKQTNKQKTAIVWSLRKFKKKTSFDYLFMECTATWLTHCKCKLSNALSPQKQKTFINDFWKWSFWNFDLFLYEVIAKQRHGLNMIYLYVFSRLG